jgi:hypothetical protein
LNKSAAGCPRLSSLPPAALTVSSSAAHRQEVANDAGDDYGERDAHASKSKRISPMRMMSRNAAAHATTSKHSKQRGSVLIVAPRRTRDEMPLLWWQPPSRPPGSSRRSAQRAPTNLTAGLAAAVLAIVSATAGLAHPIGYSN